METHYLSDRARDLSAFLEPPHAWWAMPAWLVWRFRQQPRHIEALLRRGLTGEHEPIEKFGRIE